MLNIVIFGAPGSVYVKSLSLEVLFLVHCYLQ